MGWVSTSEDIEDLRRENEHYQRGVDNLIKRLKKGTSLSEIQRVEGDLRNLAQQLIKRYEEHKTQAKIRLDEAVKYLRDPNVLITEQLKKRTRERDEARVELNKSKSQLELCRKSQTRIQSRLNELSKENTALHAAMEKLKDKAQWQSETKNIKPLRSK